MSWTAPRITGRLSAYETVGSVCGAILAIFMVGATIQQLSTGDVPGAAGFAIVAGLALAIAPISAMQALTHRRRRRALAETGVVRDGVVIDAWLIPMSDASYGGIRFRYDAGLGGVLEGIAFDGSDAVERFRPGDRVRVRFDPAQPEQAVLEVG